LRRKNATATKWGGMIYVLVAAVGNINAVTASEQVNE